MNRNHIYIILVEPVYKGNIGASARAMQNFGFTNLRLVGQPPQKEDLVMGIYSDDLLLNAPVFADLEQAIADLDRVVALSRRGGKRKTRPLQPAQLAQKVHGLPDCKIGLVFGRETYGLTNEEADLCPLRCYIPTHELFPSMNLSHAVGVICYELAAYNGKVKTVEQAADGSNIESSVEFIIDTLNAMEYFDQGRTSKVELLFKNILNRADISRSEAYEVKKVFNRILVKSRGFGLDFER